MTNVNNILKIKQKTNIQKIDTFLNIVNQFFGADVQVGSVWQWVSDISVSLKQLDMDHLEDELESQYLLTIVDNLDFELLSKVVAQLNILSGLAKKNTTKENALSNTDQELYTELKSSVAFVASLLLCYTPTNTPVLWSDAKSILDGEFDTETAVAIMRYLSQSFYGHEVEVAQYLLKNYNYLLIKFDSFGSNVSVLFDIVTVYIVGSVFGSLSETDQFEFLNKHIGKVINFNFPIQKYLEEALAEEPVVSSYIVLSGKYAQSIFASQDILYLDKNNSISAGKLLNDYSSSGIANDYKTEVYQTFVKKIVADKKDEDILQYKLEKLIILYIGLRECDLIDYRGLLSEGGAIKPKFDWLEVLKKDLTDGEKQEIRRYINLLHRPWRTKMELIVAFEAINWKQEPYLTRVLVLSDLFDQEYGRFYKPLVYFDEKIMDWIIDKELPDFFKVE